MRDWADKEAVEKGVDHLLAVGEVVGNHRRLLNEILDSACFSLENLNDRVGQLVHLIRSESRKEWLEPVKNSGEIDCRGGA